MKLYAQSDFDTNKKEKKAVLTRVLLCMLPCLAAAVAAFVMRVQWLCDVGIIAAGALAIFLYDLCVKPAISYGRFLSEAHSGLTRETVGALTRMGADPVYQDGVDFFEVIVNIYEDLSEDGERRFLLDAKKELPKEWLDHDVVVTSHGSYILEMRPARTAA